MTTAISSTQYLPLAVARFARVWTTKKWGRTPGWNLSSSSDMTSLQCLIPIATRSSLAAVCHSGIISCTCHRQVSHCYMQENYTIPWIQSRAKWQFDLMLFSHVSIQIQSQSRIPTMFGNISWQLADVVSYDISFILLLNVVSSGKDTS